MVNSSFVFGMDNDDETVFKRTVDWAISHGLETATFHILTPYPGTPLYDRMAAENRIITDNWDLYDTRHVVYRPAKLSPEKLESGYWQAYQDFYRWGSIFQGAWVKSDWNSRLRHLVYAGAWKKCEPIWDLLIRLKQVNHLIPALQQVLMGFSSKNSSQQNNYIPRFEQVSVED